MSNDLTIHSQYVEKNGNSQHVPQTRATNQHVQTMEFTSDKLDLLKQTVCKGATNDEFELFVHACKRTGLDPFMKQIHAVKRWDPKLNREAMTIQTGIDGYRLIADRTGKYMPAQEPAVVCDAQGRVVSATAFVKKWGPDGNWHTIAATAYFEEYVQTKKDKTPMGMWEKMPRSQLSKCAEALALRKAFPADLSGVYTKEEMEQSLSEGSIDVTPRQTQAQQPKPSYANVAKITLDQVAILDDLIAEDTIFRGTVLDLLQKHGAKSLADIPSPLYQRVYQYCYEHDCKRQLAKAPVIEAPAPSVFDKE